jgi:hypothetical protein
MGGGVYFYGAIALLIQILLSTKNGVSWVPYQFWQVGPLDAVGGVGPSVWYPDL